MSASSKSERTSRALYSRAGDVDTIMERGIVLTPKQLPRDLPPGVARVPMALRRLVHALKKLLDEKGLNDTGDLCRDTITTGSLEKGHEKGASVYYLRQKGEQTPQPDGYIARTEELRKDLITAGDDLLIAILCADFDTVKTRQNAQAVASLATTALLVAPAGIPGQMFHTDGSFPSGRAGVIIAVPIHYDGAVPATEVLSLKSRFLVETIEFEIKEGRRSKESLLTFGLLVKSKEREMDITLADYGELHRILSARDNGWVHVNEMQNLVKEEEEGSGLVNAPRVRLGPRVVRMRGEPGDREMEVSMLYVNIAQFLRPRYPSVLFYETPYAEAHYKGDKVLCYAAGTSPPASVGIEEVGFWVREASKDTKTSAYSDPALIQGVLGFGGNRSWHNTNALHRGCSGYSPPPSKEAEGKRGEVTKTRTVVKFFAAINTSIGDTENTLVFMETVVEYLTLFCELHGHLIDQLPVSPNDRNTNKKTV